MSELMPSEKEMLSMEIDKYTCLQRIKKDQPANAENKTLDYELRVSAAKLRGFGQALDDLEP